MSMDSGPLPTVTDVTYELDVGDDRTGGGLSVGAKTLMGKFEYSICTPGMDEVVVKLDGRSIKSEVFSEIDGPDFGPPHAYDGHRAAERFERCFYEEAPGIIQEFLKLLMGYLQEKGLKLEDVLE